METLFWLGLAGCHRSLSPLYPGSRSTAAGPADSFCLSQHLALADLVLIEVTHAKNNAGHWFDQILLTLLTVLTEVDLPPLSLLPVRLCLLPQYAVYKCNVDVLREFLNF